MDLIEYLKCPICNHDKLKCRVPVFHAQDKNVVLYGLIQCQNCQHLYPISKGIPSLMPAELANRKLYEDTKKHLKKIFNLYY